MNIVIYVISSFVPKWDNPYTTIKKNVCYTKGQPAEMFKYSLYEACYTSICILQSDCRNSATASGIQGSKFHKNTCGKPTRTQCASVNVLNKGANLKDTQGQWETGNQVYLWGLTIPPWRSPILTPVLLLSNKICLYACKTLICYTGLRAAK